MSNSKHPTRRVVLGTGAALTALHGTASAALGQTRTVAEPGVTVDVAMTVNGQHRALKLDPRTTLLDALREHLHLTGTKKGCDHGQCGACTVLVNGERRNACLNLAVARAGDDITTIEGLSDKDELHPMQAAFVAHDGFQCGSSVDIARRARFAPPSACSTS